MRKQIFLDALTLRAKKAKGAQIYVINLLKQFTAIDNNFEYTTLIGGYMNDTYLPKSNQIRYEKINTDHPSLWRLLHLSRYIKKRNFDLLHLMTEGSTLNDLTIPYIMTIHESLKKYYMYSEKQKHSFDLKSKVAKIVNVAVREKMLKKTQALIAVSNSVKRDIISDYELPGNLIKIIYGAADKEFFSGEKSQLEKRNNPIPYIMIFATGDKREIILCELRAFAQIKNEIDHHLFIAGIPEGRFQKGLTYRCQKLRILERTIFFNFLSGDKLKILYRNADLYIDMSLFEGFGLQVVEAMASGIPVIVSNIDPFSELVGNAGIVLDPNDDMALANAMMMVLKNDKKKREMSLASRAHAQKFSWEKTAEETLKIYDEVICQKSR